MPSRIIAARVVSEGRYSDGTIADEITNFRVNDAGELEYDFAIMPLIPDEWQPGGQPAPFEGVRAMHYWLIDGEYPELLFFTDLGVFRYRPGLRDSAVTYPGIEEIYFYDHDGVTIESVRPQGEARFPTQIVEVSGRIIFSYCDGGATWVYDGVRIRPFGFACRPAPPDVEGPMRNDAGSANGGGFSYKGRIGSTESDWLDPVTVEVVGGIDVGRWEYAAVLENEDGAYSETSGRDGSASHRLGMADPAGGTYLEELRRKHRIKNIPMDSAAVVLLRTANLERLPPNDAGDLHFLHRLPHGLGSEYIDDIPDGELGAVWLERQNIPTGWHLAFSFGGSTWYGRTDGAISRLWWTEQTSLSGPTPESSLVGHFRDVYPSTGGMTATIGARLSVGQDSSPVRLIFKPGAVHYLTGQYPTWQVGTLDDRAGCDGPNLVQIAPDGSIVWWGAGTFWRLSPEGKVDDIGGTVRRSCRRVHRAVAGATGQSWVDRVYGEVVFVLPYRDGIVATRQFIYDWRAGGMRFGEDIAITAACVIASDELVLVAGLNPGNDVTTVWCRGRGHWGYDFGDPPEGVYRSGWITLAPPGDGDMHAHWMAEQLIVSAIERSEASVQVRTFADWNLDDASEPCTVKLAHPESDTIPYYNPGANTPALYGTAVWRTARYYTERVAAPGGEQSFEALAVELRTTDPMALAAITVYGNVMAAPGSRNPQRHLEE